MQHPLTPQNAGLTPPPLKIMEEQEVWLQSLQEQQRGFVTEVIDSIIDFSQGPYRPYFSDCGLFAVGSSVKGNAFNDVDLVMAGMDFRTVISYNGVFIMDPKTLVEQEVVHEQFVFEVVKGTEENPEILQSFNYSTIDMWGYRGVTYEGKIYEFAPMTCGTPNLSLEGYCSEQADFSPLVKNLEGHIGRLTGKHWVQGDYPFDSYGFADLGEFLVARFHVFPISIDETKDDQIFTRDPSFLSKFPYRPIDVSFHAENLTIDAWKRVQNELALPYVPLVEWPALSDERPTIVPFDLPSFVDPEGQERVNMYHPYLHSLGGEVKEVEDISEDRPTSGTE